MAGEITSRLRTVSSAEAAGTANGCAWSYEITVNKGVSNIDTHLDLVLSGDHAH